jgi:hypothetical protein
MRLRIYGWSLVISFALVALVAMIASVPHCSAVGIVLLPGALLAAIVFPQGPESGAGDIYLVLSGLLDSLLVAFAVMWVWGLFERRRQARGR